MQKARFIPFTNSQIVAVLLCGLVAAGTVAGSRLSRLYNTHIIQSEQPVSLYIEERIGLRQLGAIMIDSAIIRDMEELVWAGNLLGWKSFSPGHYRIDGSYSYDILLSRLARGIQDPISVTVPPGRTEGDLFGRMGAALQLDSAEIAATYHDPAFLEEIGIDQKDMIGRMFPDTYSFYWTSGSELILKKIVRQFESSVREAYRGRIGEIDQSLNEIVTLASIIEWEANHNEEKPVISGVYWNRLERGMYLQADPTVNYALGERRRLLYDDYKLEHPYNTYVNEGLPPGPITNPGLSSLTAALYPADHNYLYMVAKPEGYHAFSETFEEHQRKSAEWRKWIREQYRKKREREQEQGVNSQLQ